MKFSKIALFVLLITNIISLCCQSATIISQNDQEIYYRISTIMPASIEKCTKALEAVETMYTTADGDFGKIDLVTLSDNLGLLNKFLKYPLQPLEFTTPLFDFRKAQSWNSFRNCLSMIFIDMITVLKRRAFDLKLTVEKDFCKLFTPNSMSSLKAYPDILVFFNIIECMTDRLSAMVNQHLNSSFLISKINQWLPRHETDFKEVESIAEFMKKRIQKRSYSCDAIIKEALALQRVFVGSCQEYVNARSRVWIKASILSGDSIISPLTNYLISLSELITPLYLDKDFADITGNEFAELHTGYQLKTILSTNGLEVVEEYKGHFKNIIKEYISQIPFIKKRQKEARDSLDKIASLCLDVLGIPVLVNIRFVYIEEKFNDILRSAYRLFINFSNAQLDTMEDVIKYSNDFAFVLRLRKVIWSLLTLRGIKDKTLWIFLLDAKKLAKMVLRTIFIPDGFNADDVRTNVYKEIAHTFATEKYDLVTEWKKRPHNVLFFLGHVFNDLEFLEKLADIDVAPLIKSIYIHFVPYLEELLENSPAPMYHMIPFEFINVVYELLEKEKHLRPLREKLEKHCLFHLPQHILDNRSLLLRRFILPRTNTNMLRNWLVLREDCIPINDRIAIKKLFDSIDILEQGYKFFFQKETLKCVVDLFFIEYNDNFNYYVSLDSEVEVWDKLIWKIGEYIRSREDDYMTPKLNLNSLGDPDLYEGQSRHVKQIEELLMSLVENSIDLRSDVKLMANDPQIFTRSLGILRLALITLGSRKFLLGIENPNVREIIANFTKSIIEAALRRQDLYSFYGKIFINVVLDLCVGCRKGMVYEREELVPLVEIFQGPFLELDVKTQLHLIPYLSTAIYVIKSARMYVNIGERTIRLFRSASSIFFESIKLLASSHRTFDDLRNISIFDTILKIRNLIDDMFEAIKNANPFSTSKYFEAVTLSEIGGKVFRKSMKKVIQKIRKKLRSLRSKLNHHDRCAIS